ncbi:Hypothetical predicted protein [Podarcis lilfordi]|uniref:Uncharacterized protein n=1 Tax=Podarcis lilfordi TaxID=74358 RepID=A0AA35PG40_9SAUR|nr:Hypothetical predicted protein [Podarcis lilfordi]
MTSSPIKWSRVPASYALQPPLNAQVRSELVEKTIRKVFSLPSQKLTKLRDGSPMRATEMQVTGPSASRDLNGGKWLAGTAWNCGQIKKIEGKRLSRVSYK